jgi:hypothetical protein
MPLIIIRKQIIKFKKYIKKETQNNFELWLNNATNIVHILQKVMSYFFIFFI